MIRGNQKSLGKLTALGLCAALAFSGCGKTKSKQRLENKRLGTLSYLSQEQLEILKNKGIQTKAVHKTTSLYHIENMTQKEVQELLPQANSVQNIQITYDTPFKETQEKPIEDPVIKKAMEILDTCDDKAAQPQPVIHFTDVTDSEKATIAIVNRTTIKLTAEMSLTAKEHDQILKNQETAVTEASVSQKTTVPSDLNFIWNIQGSQYSRLHPVQMGKNFEIKPDIRGNISVVLFLQDKITKGCAIVPVDIVATENKQLLNVQPVSSWNEFMALDFNHVKQVDADKAWAQTKGEGVVIAVIDSGVNYNHPDLNQNTFINKGEIPGNAMDDDGNGYVDDVYGWDFVNSDNRPYDDGGHGTHVAGIAAASSFGIAPMAQILPLKTSSGGGSSLKTILEATYYAADMGADVINMSFGAANDGESEQAKKVLNLEELALRYANKKGALVVAAAGNGDLEGNGINNEEHHQYPSDFRLDGNISVAAVNTKNKLAVFSNYGVRSVDIAAPGGDMSRDESIPTEYIMSADMYAEHNLYIGFSGTSMATPIVAGVAALVKAANPSLTPAEIKRILMASGTRDTELMGKIVSGSIVNALNAVNMARSNNLTRH